MSVVPSSKKLTEDQLEGLAKAANIEIAVLKAFCEVEGGGIGFSDVTGRMIIRLEGEYFKRNHKGDERHGVWEQKMVNQTSAWAAFLDAANIDKKAAMLSTSMGIMQIMGFNWDSCGFDNVEDMWLFNEISEENQVETGIRFIMANPKLYAALKNKNWTIVATLYNGAGFLKYSERNNTLPYDKKIANAYVRFSNQMPHESTVTTVNLRGGSGTQFPVIEVLRVNTSLIVTGKYNGWKQVKVISTGNEGWVKSELTK